MTGWSAKTAQPPPAVADGVAESIPARDRFWERAPTAASSAAPVAELLELTLASGARRPLDRQRYPKPDRRLDDALHILSTVLRAVAHDPEVHSDDPD
ncbi:MAG: hypothetical protein IPM89_08115 [Candidatus Competibacteraceae bacterium]|nr:MAG: hypothetical protein IPM89_08115 [Candidatus Competibacteraceae bacterium]